MGQLFSCVRRRDRTGARVNFKDDAPGEPDRTLAIRGTPESAQQAELEVRKAIAEMPPIVTEEILVPERAVGRIIGKGGDTIRQICRISKAKVNVPRSDERKSEGTCAISLKGTPDAIENAKALIEEKVAEEEAFRARLAVSTANRSQRGKQPHEGATGQDDTLVAESAALAASAPTAAVKGPTSGATAERQDRVEGPWPASRDFLETYVSAVDTAGHFWVQVLSSRSTQLDRLTEQMTSHYSTMDASQACKAETLHVGDVVAAPFPHDNSWYRARVVGFEKDQVDLYYVDYGDNGLVPHSQVMALRSDFLSLPFQAIECFLAKVKPKGESWSDEAADRFEELTYAAKWKVIMAKIISYRQTETGAVPCVELVDTNGPVDVNVAEELVRMKFADWTSDEDDTSKSPTTAPKEVAALP